MKAAVVLSGCGVIDGAEIHEAVLTLYAIEKAGGTYQIFAPNVTQHHVVNHLTGEATGESRNVMVEAARIARGKIKPMTDYHTSEFDALVFPGGFGVAKNLCTYAFDGTDCRIDRVVEQAIIATHRAHKPIGATCISPVMIVKVLGNITVTIGNDTLTASDIEKMGGKHLVKGHGEVAVDKENLIVTTPCYMINSTISDIARDTEALVKAITELLGESN